MNNMVIYRKYRPQTFSQIVGQEHIVRMLQGALVSDHTPHAYIFTGPRGTGKTTTARIFAKALNCQENHKTQTTEHGTKSKRPTTDDRRQIEPPAVSNVEPCTKCQSCMEIAEGRSLDLMEIDAASNRGIDDIRELRDGIRYSPTGGGYKVYIIDEFHQLSKAAFNALLKTLEEPPPHAIFILATTEMSKVPDTVQSRALRFDFRLFGEEEIVKELSRIAKLEGMDVEREALSAIAKSAAGSLRDAETLLEQLFLLGKKKVSYDDAKEILGFADFHAVLALADNILAGKTSEAISFFGEVYEKGEDIDSLMTLLAEWVRKLLLYRIDEKLEPLLTRDIAPHHLETLKKHAALATVQQFAKIQQLLIDKDLELKRTSFPRLVCELAIVEIGEILKSPTLQKISKV